MNMLRFILDCLRPARTRAAAATRDTELEAQVNTSHDHEIKGLQDEVHMEQETLQTVKALCRNTQETVEMLEERKTQLKEELKMIYNLQKQEKEVLQSLQEEQQELEQTVQQYDMELCAAAEDLLQLQREVAYAKAHAESLHLRITPLQDLFEEIIQVTVKKKLAELVAGLIAGESSMNEMTEDPCAVLEQELEASMDVVESECNHVYIEKNTSKPEGEEVNDVEQENTVEELHKMQYSMENLKSSGSSSFTEITLTEVKEEDVMFRSTTPQSDSSDIEKEDFEIIQPCQVTNRQFDFFHPNPFTDGDVFGDDHFPKVDVTEQLPRDPFKGTDPFASDALLVNMPEEEHYQDELIPAEDSLPEAIHYPRQSVVKDYGTFNTPVNMPPDADCTQSTGKRDSGVSMSNESRSLKSGSDVDYEFDANDTQDQNCDDMLPDQSNEAASPQFNEECVHDSDSSHSSTVFNSIDADSNVFAEEEEDRVDIQAGSGLRVNSLCGLQSIIAGSYTGFPLSPCDPLPGEFQKTFEQHIIASEQNAANDKELEKTESSSPDNSPGPLGEQLHDKNSNPSSSPCVSPSQPSALDVYDYKYGDMFFFTVRLDPGSPELHNQSPVCPEPNDAKKDESSDASLSPEFNNVDELECASPKPEDTEQHSHITNDLNEIATNIDSPKHDEILVPDSEKVVLQIPSVTFEDSNACQSVLDSEWKDQWMAIQDVAEPVPDPFIHDTESNPPNSTTQDLFCLFSDTETSTTDQFYPNEQLSPESGSSQHKPSCSEGSAMSKLELQYFDPFCPIPTEPVKGVSELEELNTVNTFCHEAPRLDSGYHEVGTPTPFSPEPADRTKCSIDLQGPGLETRKQSNSEIHVPDPFSPESVDTGIFDSETENCESGYMITTCQLLSPQPVCTDLNNLEEKQISCDVLSDHLSGSEHDDSYPFGSCPSNEESYAYSSGEKLIEPIREVSDAFGESKPSSIVSDASDSSQVFHSVWGNSEMSFPNPEVLDPMKNNVFDFDTTDFGLFEPNVSQEAEEDTHCAGKVVKNADLAEIDYFCSELSKMVSSSSSDSVQQSVAEMLFGSEPNTTSFYPWDFEKPQHSC
ncbi:microtubule-associated protein 1B isoform X1 [Labeo rohita]|uniref:microtubule-associated protein 1B isoform X1 n=1 Tax=Labeo rohita TaxID=84645 RepID=UPI0021E2E116|nr:microtubule-associated protein 1B isoform X1 [Labeo rohita]